MKITSIHIASRRGFTLIEILLASTIFAMLIAALYTVYYGTMRLRETTFDKVEAALPIDYTTGIIHRDLSAAVPPAGILAGAFTGTSTTENSVRTDRVEFCSTSGRVTDDNPWGDIQKVAYYLADPSETETRRTAALPESKTLSGSKKQQDLVRAVTRNLLAPVAEDPPEEHLLRNVESFEVTYYDGETWLDSWDSAAQGNKLPSAVKVSIGFPVPETDSQTASNVSSRPKETKPHPSIELYCELVTKPRPTQSVTATTSGSGTSGGGTGSKGGTGGGGGAGGGGGS